MLPLPLQLPLPFSRRSGASAPAPHKNECRSSYRSFTALEAYKKTNVFLLIQAQQIKSKKSKRWSFVTKDGAAVVLINDMYELVMSDFKCEE